MFYLQVQLREALPSLQKMSPKSQGLVAAPHLHVGFLPPPLWWYFPPLVVGASSFPLNYLFILYQNLSHSPEIFFLNHEPPPSFPLRRCDHHPSHHHKTIKQLSQVLPHLKSENDVSSSPPHGCSPTFMVGTHPPSTGTSTHFLHYSEVYCAAKSRSLLPTTKASMVDLLFDLFRVVQFMLQCLCVCR